MPKIIILVIAIDSVFYNEFKKIWKKYCHTYSNIKVFFIYNNDQRRSGLDDPAHGLITYPSIEYNKDEYDIIYKQYEEIRSPCIYLKTIRAMEYIEDNYDYDFLIRTTLSTFWNFDAVNRFFEQTTLSDTKCNGVIQYRPKIPPFIQGYGIILTRGAVKTMIENQDTIKSHNPYMADDKVISWFFRKHLDGLHNIDEKNLLTLEHNGDKTLDSEVSFNYLKNNNIGDVMYFRIKHARKNYKERTPDIEMHKYLCSRIYNVE